ncbi:unnamed protein product [Effrenium voratum]|uniref:Protein kinase domain-containing protein n=1 Tax=Effrenium voratum TaxID=2562239 RepID=A0AA36N8A5_9DINO|nr:unnamed protein product [Effrenium voratum]
MADPASQQQVEEAFAVGPKVVEEDDELEEAVLLSLRLACRAKLLRKEVDAIDLDYLQRCTENFAEHRLLGEGGYGKVYKAVDKDEHLEFAAKCLVCENEEERQMMNRMTQAEITTLTAFTHPNIIRLLGYCKTEDTAVLLYEYQPGGSVETHLDEKERAEDLTWTLRANIVKGLVDAIHHLHRHDPAGPCYHRDVKPGNIVLTADGDPKLIDCGLARLAQADVPGSKTRFCRDTGGSLGTPGFKCSKFERTGKFEEKSEVYSIGITILQIVTGIQDFGDDNLDKLVECPRASSIMEMRDQRPPFEDKSDNNIIHVLANMVEQGIATHASRCSLQTLCEHAALLNSRHLACRAKLLQKEVDAVDLDYLQRCTENFAEHRLLGEGGYGKVYKAVDKDEHLEFAAKCLVCENEEERQMMNRMTQAEITTLTAFTHPNIIRLLGYCKTEDTAVLLYEYQPGGSVETHLDEKERAEDLTWTLRANIVKGLVDAIHHLHRHDPAGPCYHRDVKPGNIVLTADGDPKLIDCGLARLAQADVPGSKTRFCRDTGGSLGTPGFKCSKFERTGKFEEKSEVYSIGITILQIVTGIQDFGDDNLEELVVNPRPSSIIEMRDQRPPFEDESDNNIIHVLANMVEQGIATHALRCSLQIFCEHAALLSSRSSTMTSKLEPVLEPV